MIIGILGAMEEEVKDVISEMTSRETIRLGNKSFKKGKLKGIDAVVVKCGIGKVNAAMCTQILIDVFRADAVINIGVAGGLDSVRPGDVIAAEDLLQHDVDGTACNYEPGQIPKLKTLAFDTDRVLLEKVLNFSPEGYKLLKGRIVTGDQIIASKERVEFFKNKFKANAVEMESGAIAQVCYLNEKPFVVIRGISDMADEDMNSIYAEYETIAMEHVLEVFRNLIGILAGDVFEA